MTTAIYDGNCVLCKQSKNIIHALDWLHRVEFLNVHDWNQVEARYPQISFEQAMGQMQVVTPDGTLLSGFEGVRRLLRDLPLGYPAWLLLHLPGMAWSGTKVYGFIARHRYQINKFFGAPVCEDGMCKVHG
jgi:predicted DCC family thiol-disulfide oxidoreductase YuxK